MPNVDLRKLIVTGKTDDGSHSLVATMYEHADHVDKLHVYLLSHGYEVDIPEPDTHSTPPTGEVHEKDYTLNPLTAAHHDYMVSIHDGEGDYNPAAHVARLKAQKGMK